MADQFGFLKDWKLALLVALLAKETSRDRQESSQGATQLVRGFSMGKPLSSLVEIAEFVQAPPYFLEYSPGASQAAPRGPSGSSPLSGILPRGPPKLPPGDL